MNPGYSLALGEFKNNQCPEIWTELVGYLQFLKAPW